LGEQHIKHPGLVITFTGPSGTGKNTVSNEVMGRDEKVKYFVTATTREPRSYEKEGVDYYFLTKEDFEKRLDNDEFLEWSRHYNNYYGALKEELHKKLQVGHDPHTDITWSGAKSIRDYMPENTICILLMPPSLEALDERMAKRKKVSGEADDHQRVRLQKIREDMLHWQDPDFVFTNDDMKGSKLSDYDYVVVNRDLEEAIQSIIDILKVERKKREY
jgi:guanylate kinase